MPELRQVLEAAGFAEVTTYLQSGNAILASDADPDDVEQRCEDAIHAALGLDVRVIVRDRDQVAALLASRPLPRRRDQPEAIPGGLLQRGGAAGSGGSSCEAFVWTPESVQRSKLWNPATGAVATARNWSTVQALHTLLDVTAGAIPPP